MHFPVEEEVPETKDHLELRTALYQILKFRFAAEALIGSEQFVYWDPTNPAACLAPDVFVRLGTADEAFDCWKVWERGAPHLAVEIISRSDARDAVWEEKLAKYARLGIRELVRFDAEDAERPLRIWDQIEGDLVERRLPAKTGSECSTLGLYWVVVPSAELPLRLSHDPGGKNLLSTPFEEAARAEAALQRALDAEAAAQKAQDAEAAALRRVRELEEALARKG